MTSEKVKTLAAPDDTLLRFLAAEESIALAALGLFNKKGPLLAGLKCLRY